MVLSISTPMYFVLVNLQELLPIVFMHGFSQQASDNSLLLTYIKEKMPDAYILNCEVGNGKVDSIFMTISD